MNSALTSISVKTIVKAPIEKVWKLWTTSDDIIKWNNPTEHWHTTQVQKDFSVGGSFLFRMETKDGSIGFDHKGRYDKIIPNELVEYTVSDGRKTRVIFKSLGNETYLTETFEPETQTPIDEQRDFCQGVLTNFKRYAEDTLHSA